MTIQALAQNNGNRTSKPDSTLNQSDGVRWGGRVQESDGYIRNRLDIDVEKIVALKLPVSKKEQRRIEIEAQGEIVKDFKVGNVRVKINDAYCRDKTPAEVQSILAGISSRTQEQLEAQEVAKLKP